MTKIATLPQEFRDTLAQGFRWALQPGGAKVHLEGRHRPVLDAIQDTQTVETVWMPEGDEGEAGDGSEAGIEGLNRLGGVESRHHLRFEPGGLRSRIASSA